MNVLWDDLIIHQNRAKKLLEITKKLGEKIKKNK
jgi:hypothetical protein